MWPTIIATIENVFVDVKNRGRSRTQETHAVLAYGYSVGGSYYSGEIRLLTGEQSLDLLEKELVGKPLSVHYDPDKARTSIFLEQNVEGWSAIEDSRISVWSWLDKLL